MRVFLHLKRAGEAWKNQGEEFEQIPRVGDFVAPSSTGCWHKVTLVVWLPESAKTTYQAEVYAVEYDHLTAHRVAHGDEVLAASNWPAEESSAKVDRGHTKT